MFLAVGCAAPGSERETLEIAVGGDVLTVWVSDDAEERQQGLMGLEALPEEVDGMVFVWGEPGPRSFHMEDTLIPLDIWWFDAGGVLIGMDRMEPCPETPCPNFLSPRSVRWALETPAGEWAFPREAVLSFR